MQQKKIGLVVCSYNGCEDTIKCIESLQKQSLRDFDIYVVDNASVDGTAEKIRSLFADEVQVLRQEENLGGAGGFAAGIEHVASLGYEYIALMDNDIIVDECAMEKMMDCLEADASLGAVGAKVMWMHRPEIIFDFGDIVDVERQMCISPYREVRDSDRVPEIVSTDFVPATAGIFRRQAIVEAGSMPVDNFIYYDDVEMGWKMKLKGWKMVCCGSARVWHKSSNSHRKHDNFAEYYFRRNTLNFTAKYLDEEKIPSFVEAEINKVFPILYGCGFKEQWQKFMTTFYTFHDFACHVRGKAGTGRIQPFILHEKLINKRLDRLFSLGCRFVRICIEEDASRGDVLLKIMHDFCLSVPEVRFAILARKQLEGMEGLPLGEEVAFEGLGLEQCQPVPEDFHPDLTIHYCGHVKDRQTNVLPDICLDRYYNVIDDEQAWDYFQNYEVALAAFRGMYREPMLAMIKELRYKSLQ